MGAIQGDSHAILSIKCEKLDEKGDKMSVKVQKFNVCVRFPSTLMEKRNPSLLVAEIHLPSEAFPLSTVYLRHLLVLREDGAAFV